MACSNKRFSFVDVSSLPPRFRNARYVHVFGMEAIVCPAFRVMSEAFDLSFGEDCFLLREQSFVVFYDFSAMQMACETGLRSYVVGERAVVLSRDGFCICCSANVDLSMLERRFDVSFASPLFSIERVKSCCMRLADEEMPSNNICLAFSCAFLASLSRWPLRSTCMMYEQSVRLRSEWGYIAQLSRNVVGCDGGGLYTEIGFDISGTRVLELVRLGYAVSLCLAPGTRFPNESMADKVLLGWHSAVLLCAGDRICFVDAMSACYVDEDWVCDACDLVRKSGEVQILMGVRTVNKSLEQVAAYLEQLIADGTSNVIYDIDADSCQYGLVRDSVFTYVDVDDPQISKELLAFCQEMTSRWDCVEHGTVCISLRELDPNAGVIEQSEFIYKQIEYLRMIHDADARGERVENMSDEYLQQIRELDFSHLGLVVRRGKDGTPVLVVS